jgi:6-pyruvoyltetrahydropterin/6-carboxytetrahydropterin synthase
MIFLTRKAEFSAAHFYFNPAWSEEENERVFGKCANRQGHGHNYTLEVTVAGEIDPVTGFVVDLKELKDIMEREVVGVFDHRHLNHEVPEFADDGERGGGDLAAAGGQDPQREAAPRAGI